MPVAKKEPPNPLPIPAGLSDHRGVKREMIALYRQAKRGLIDPALLGRLAHLLSLIGGAIRDVEHEARIAKLEAAVELESEGATPWSANGGTHARH
jgi:hypothetical protein